MRIIEFIHDRDFPEMHTNLDIWVGNQENVRTERFYCYRGEEFPSPDSFDLLIVHGGDQHLWEKEKDPWLYREIDYVARAIEAGKPVIGFCLGSQIITEARGGKVFPSETKEIGFYHIRPREDRLGHRLLKGLEKGFSTLEWHTDHYSLPESLESLAYTEGVPNQIVVSPGFPVAGFQFHPEYTREIIRYFSSCFPETVWQIEGRPGLSTEELQAYTDTREETYGLFELLLTNVLSYFSDDFPHLASFREERKEPVCPVTGSPFSDIPL